MGWLEVELARGRREMEPCGRSPMARGLLLVFSTSLSDCNFRDEGDMGVGSARFFGEERPLDRADCGLGGVEEDMMAQGHCCMVKVWGTREQPAGSRVPSLEATEQTRVLPDHVAEAGARVDDGVRWCKDG